MSSAAIKPSLPPAESGNQAAMQYLRLVNATTAVDELVEASVHCFREQSGCEAVGIRMRKGDDYPYCESQGFAEDFILRENSLCARCPDGQPMLDDAGNPVLECMCGNVIAGRTDPTKPFFTTNGSFWTNSTTELLTNTSEAERQARTRNRCHGEGFESVLLIPLRLGTETFGLLQFNDRRKGMFTPERIAAFETLAGYLAVALGRARAEQALREACRYKDQIIRSAQEGIIVYGPDLLYRVWNPWMEQITGMPASKVLGTHPDEFFPFLREAEVLERLERVLRGEHCEALEFPYHVPQTGKSGWCVTTDAPLLDDHGRTIGVISIIRDVTERRQGEATAREQQAAIAHLSRVASVGEMATSIAHELNQPLCAITNYAGLCLDLLGSGQIDTMRQTLQGVVEAAERASQIVRQIRSYARKQDSPRTARDMNSVVRGALEIMRPELRHAGIRPLEELAEGLPEVQADAVHIQQVVVNLIQNAIDAMIRLPTARRKLAIRSLPVPSGMITVSIIDEGCGLPPGPPEQVFASFFTTKPGGLGLGLAICRSIIESHGGRLSITPNPVGGVIAEFTLPSV